MTCPTVLIPIANLRRKGRGFSRNLPHLCLQTFICGNVKLIVWNLLSIKNHLNLLLLLLYLCVRECVCVRACVCKVSGWDNLFWQHDTNERGVTIPRIFYRRFLFGCEQSTCTKCCNHINFIESLIGLG